MKPDVLIAGSLMPHVRAALDAAYATHDLVGAPDRQALLREIGPRIRAIATSTFDGCPVALMEACPKVEIIASFGVGVDSLNVEDARRRGIVVANTPDVLNDDVANMAVALVLATTRNIVANDRYVRAGRWKREGDPPLARGLAGRRVGIVGFGRIGKAIARKLGVFGCEIVYHTRNPQPDQPFRHYPDLVEMARDSALLVVITPGGAATQNLIDRAVMDALGPEGILVNVARGSVVDEAALVAALQEGRLGGAGLDVFAREPDVPEALFAMENVVLQPHQASATRETRRAMGDLVVTNLAAHFEGRPHDVRRVV
ncbi:2-hydroxyacid dehydrogenase [Propylenella binzhouense]|uniref:2-hydroxyacid dehydrogenase n=1 Tax=Propylenella binzhouense TaxID=2555902 RepID=A0A964T749_9HYPH|nr:2-hydroxyacid dehydrogenase [Propylenella binzhouense]MYZ49064.1 2-hydroxyacid dehydrogenase [Propylenella binzhouense]